MSSGQLKRSEPIKSTSGVLLTTADRQIEALVGRDRSFATFTDSLFESVLLHQGVVIPDIFAFISTVISEQSISTKTTMLEHALAAGVAVPAFRGGADSFELALECIQDLGILGLTERSKSVAYRLDNARQSAGEEIFHIQWGSKISVHYGACVIAALVDLEDEHCRDFSQMPELKLTQFFISKHGFLDRIREQVSKNNGDLRRGFLFQVMLDVLNSISSSQKNVFTDVSDLLMHPACAGVSEVSVGVRNLICLFNLIYQRNMAHDFNANCYLSGQAYPKSVLDIASVAINRSSLQSDIAVAENQSIQDDHTKFKIKIPSMRQLESVGMERLLEIRAKHTKGYFAHLKSWQDGAGSAEDLERSLCEYSRELALAVNLEASFVDVVLSRFTGVEKSGILAAAKLAIQVLAESNSLVKSFSAGLGAVANVTYSWAAQRQVEVSINRQRNIVI